MSAIGGLPLVSCMMISQPPRLVQMEAAIQDFCRQTYPSKELMIVVDDAAYAREVHALVERVEESIYVLELEDRTSLGALRNVAAEHSHGEWICQWDDDDRYAPTRLELQSLAVREAKAVACFLHQQMHFFADTRELFWTDWRLLHGQTRYMPPSSCIPGTVFFRRGSAAYPETGHLAARGEDSVLAAELWRAGAVVIEAPPRTYLRTFHGENTWDRQHHYELARARAQSAETMVRWRDELVAAACYFGLESPVHFMGGEGIVFTG